MCLCPSQHSRSALSIRSSNWRATQVFIHQASLRTSSHPQQWGTHGETQKRRQSHHLRAVLSRANAQHSQLTFLPSKSAGVNNSGRFSIILILSSKWLALKILEGKQKCWFCWEKEHNSELLYLCAVLWPNGSGAPLSATLLNFSPPRASYRLQVTSWAKCLKSNRNISCRHTDKAQK